MEEGYLGSFARWRKVGSASWTGKFLDILV